MLIDLLAKGRDSYEYVWIIVKTVLLLGKRRLVSVVCIIMFGPNSYKIIHLLEVATFDLSPFEYQDIFSGGSICSL